MTTKLDVAAIRARADAATPGPWTHKTPELNSEDPWGSMMFELRRDYEFAEAARTDVPALCDEVERLTSENRAHVAYITSQGDRIEALEKALGEILGTVGGEPEDFEAALRALVGSRIGAARAEGKP